MLADWSNASIQEQQALPLGVTGKEENLESKVVEQIEGMIEAMDKETAQYELAKKGLDTQHKKFCTGPLADTIKIS